MSEVLIRAENVSKKFCRDLKKSLWYGVKDSAADLLRRDSTDARSKLRTGEFWANEDISFEVRRGECLGLIGRNGAGKTTLLKMLSGLIKPDSGRIEMRGRVGALIALGAGFNPILSGRENIYINGSVLGLSRSEIDAKVEDIIDFADIRDFIDAPVQSYSSGMNVRLGFAVATTMEPDVLILDEVLAVGDATFRTKCFQRIGKILHKSAVMFVSHSEAQVQRICNRALWMKRGVVQSMGEVTPIMNAYRDSQAELGNSLDEWVMGMGVTSVNVPDRRLEVPWGDGVSFVVEITCSEPVDISNLYLQWHIGGAAVMQSDVPADQIRALRLRRGLNRIEIQSGPVHLARGEYDVSFAAFTSRGKESVAHTFCALKVRLDSSLGIGPAVLIPAAAELL